MSETSRPRVSEANQAFVSQLHNLLVAHGKITPDSHATCIVVGETENITVDGRLADSDRFRFSPTGPMKPCEELGMLHRALRDVEQETD